MHSKHLKREGYLSRGTGAEVGRNILLEGFGIDGWEGGETRIAVVVFRG